MTNNIVPFSQSKVASVFAQKAAIFGDVTHGITEGFATLRYKGKVWKVKKGGEEKLWLGPDGEPAASIEVVIVNAASAISKSYHSQGFVEGQEVGAPDCWSVNGVTPDPASAKKQHSSCASCPKNIFGSANNGNGKACSDRRRIAIVPTAMLMQGKENPFGGPIMVSVPPTSLKALAQYQKDCQALGGYPYYAVSTRISFDTDKAHPVFKFKAVRPLTDGEAEMVVELAMDELTNRMLNMAVEEEVKHDTHKEEEPKSFFEQPTQTAAAQEPVAQEEPPFETAQTAKRTRTKKVEEPVQETKAAVASSDLDSTLTGLFG